MTGTAAEVKSVTQIDTVKIGTGKMGQNNKSTSKIIYRCSYGER